jgi:ubiquitin-activating enzyme E1
MHIGFVVAAANIHAYNYGLKGGMDVSFFKQVVSSTIIPEFTPKSGIKIAANEAEAAQSATSATSPDDSELDRLIKALPPSSSFAGMRLFPAEFEKVFFENNQIGR